MGLYSFGAIPSPVDIRDYVLNSTCVDTSILPKEYCIKNLRVKNQGTKCTCVPHALSEIIEYHTMKDGNKYVEFSTDFIYGFRNEDDYLGEGMYLRDGLKVIQKYGDVPVTSLPGNSTVPVSRAKVQSQYDMLIAEAFPHRISTYFKINRVDELKYSIYTNGPVVAGMKWYDGSSLDSNKVYQFDPTKGSSGHAVIIIGWTEDHWIVQNSWGRFWGDKGTFKLPIISSLDLLFFDIYGITDDIETVVKPSSITKLFSFIINWMYRCFNKWFSL